MSWSAAWQRRDRGRKPAPLVPTRLGARPGSNTPHRSPDLFGASEIDRVRERAHGSPGRLGPDPAADKKGPANREIAPAAREAEERPTVSPTRSHLGMCLTGRCHCRHSSSTYVMRTSQENLRLVFNQVSRDRLLAICDALRLPVQNRRDKTPAVDTLVAAAPEQLEAILAKLSREDLNAACKKVGVNSSGVHKGPVARRLADFITGGAKTAAAIGSAEPTGDAQDTVFVVHGHDQAMKNEVQLLLHEVGLRPIVLSEQPNQGMTLIEKLLHNAERAYALILLSPDDIGGPRGSLPERQLGRARQNVILELGLFVGKLGRSRVGVLYKPGVELPSDISGVVYIAYESIDAARHAIIKELKAAGLPLSMARLFGH